MLKKFGKYIVFFIILFLLTFLFLIKGQDLGFMYETIIHIKFHYVLLGALLMCIYMMGDTLNSKLLLKEFGYNKSIFDTLKYAFIGFFYSSITPSSSGGQPMQAYHMKKDGIDLSHSTIILLLEAISFHIITLLYMIVGVITNYEYLVNNLRLFGLIFIFGISISIFVLGILMSILFSKKASYIIVKIVKKLIKLLRLKNEKDLLDKLEDGIKEFRKGSDYLMNHKIVFLKVLLVTFMQVSAMHSVTYITTKAFNIDMSYFKILTLQAVLYSSILAIPLPGSMGVNEAGFKVLFMPIFGKNYVRSAILINRFLNFYLFIIISAIVSIISYIKVNRAKK